MIVVCGEALIDVFIRQDGGALGAEAVAGGSPYNVALGLARLECPAAYWGGVSRDALGSFLLDSIARDGVDVSLVRRVANRTTLSVVATDAEGHPGYAFYGEDGADRALDPSDLPELPPAAAAIAIGSYALAVEPVATAIEAMLERERGRLVVSLDPNLRPRVVGDVAAWRPRFERFVAGADIVKASTEDLGPLYGEGADIAAVARNWLARGPALVVFTRGPDGAVAFARSGAVVDRPGRVVPVVDTVGAGDTFHAALLAWLARAGRLERGALRELGDDEIAAVLDEAVAASAITCSRRGADLPRRAEVEALMRRQPAPSG
ncbi:carbohydrate kinase family protein [Alsobacter sp. SYSU BS001988]